MKKFTIEVSHASPAQLTTIALDLKIMSNNWERFGPRIVINGQKLQAWQLVPEMIGYIRKRYNMETKQLKRIADAIEEILRLIKKDMGEMKKAAKWKNSQ